MFFLWLTISIIVKTYGTFMFSRYQEMILVHTQWNCPSPFMELEVKYLQGRSLKIFVTIVTSSNLSNFCTNCGQP